MTQLPGVVSHRNLKRLVTINLSLGIGHGGAVAVGFDSLNLQFVMALVTQLEDGGDRLLIGGLANINDSLLYG